MTLSLPVEAQDLKVFKHFLHLLMKRKRKSKTAPREGKWRRPQIDLLVKMNQPIVLREDILNHAQVKVWIDVKKPK